MWLFVEYDLNVNTSLPRGTRVFEINFGNIKTLFLYSISLCVVIYQSILNISARYISFQHRSVPLKSPIYIHGNTDNLNGTCARMLGSTGYVQTNLCIEGCICTYIVNNVSIYPASIFTITASKSFTWLARS